MAAKPMTPKPSELTSADIRSSDWLGSVDFIDKATGAHARVECASDWFVTWTSGGFRFVTRRDVFMSRYSALPNV